MNFERRKPSLKPKIYGRQAVRPIALASGEGVRPSKTTVLQPIFSMKEETRAVLRRGVVNYGTWQKKEKKLS